MLVLFLYFFFICMPVSKERPVRVVIGNQLFLRGREVKATVFGTAHIDFGWFADRSSPTEVGEDLILTRSSWTDRSSIHPKLKSKLDVECRKTLGSTARTGRQTLLPKVFN